MSTNLLVEETVDDEDEGALLGVEEQENVKKYAVRIGDIQEYPIAAEDDKLGQAFKHHTHHHICSISVTPLQVLIFQLFQCEDHHNDDDDVESHV